MTRRSRAPRTCPKCGAKTVPILYGEPTPDAFQAAERGELVLGGCVVSDDSPSRTCTTCGHAFGRVRLR